MALIEMLFEQTATIEIYTGIDDGEPEYRRENKPRPCRVTDRAHLNKGAYAEGVMDAEPRPCTLYTVGAPIPPRSRVTVDGKTYTVTDCKDLSAFGQRHLEVEIS